MVADQSGLKSEASFKITVSLPAGFPVITQQPRNLTVIPRSQVSFAVQAIGAASLRYQWLKDGAELPGETASTLLLADVQPGHAGNYQVQVSNELGFVLSEGAELLVEVPITVSGGTAEGIFEMSIQSPKLMQLAIEASTNLSIWETIQVLTNELGSLRFRETDTRSLPPYRFYRGTSASGGSV